MALTEAWLTFGCPPPPHTPFASLGGDAAPLHIAVPNTPPTKGPFTFAVGYMGGSVKLMTLVRNKDDFIDDDTLIAERDKVRACACACADSWPASTCSCCAGSSCRCAVLFQVIANKGPGASGTGAAAQKEASGGVIIAQPPRNTMPVGWRLPGPGSGRGEDQVQGRIHFESALTFLCRFACSPA